MGVENRAGQQPKSFRTIAIEALVGPEVNPDALQAAEAKLATITSRPSNDGSRMLPGSTTINLKKIVSELHPREVATLVAGSPRLSWMSDSEASFLLGTSVEHWLFIADLDAMHLLNAVLRIPHSPETKNGLHEAQEALYRAETERNLLSELFVQIDDSPSLDSVLAGKN